MKAILFFCYTSLFLVAFCANVFGGYKDDIGYSFLVYKFEGTPPVDGSGIPVVQVESPSEGNWMPDLNSLEFSEKSLIDVTGGSDISSHATSVGKYFYGNASSIAPGVTDISVYEVNDWLQWRLDGGFLYWKTLLKPGQSSNRVANHSWVSTFTMDPDPYSSDIFRRLDWVVEQDEYIQVVALNNGSIGKKLLSSARNVIAVGLTNGNHPVGTIYVDDIYTANRTLPHLVAPFEATSWATPVVSAAVSLLVEAGSSDPLLSTDPEEVSTVSRAGITIYNAERSEVIKAVLMAGADRFTQNSADSDIRNYRESEVNQAENGLDKRFGAGQLNIFNSYEIITAGEQNSIEDDPSQEGEVIFQGFDYDPSFGGIGGSNSTGTYYFTTDEQHLILSATLAWNLKIDGGGVSPPIFDGDATYYDMDLYLYDMTTGGEKVIESTSSLDNTENIYIALQRDHDYLLQVTTGEGQDSFEWDYALAWQILTDVDNDNIPDQMDIFPDDPEEWTDDDDDGLGDNFESIIIDFDPDDDLSVLEDVIPEDDFDNDDFSNMEEFLRGSDPTEFNLLADMNGDCIVNTLDFALYRLCFGDLGGPADFNNDGIVNTLDFAILRLQFGKTCPQ